jgi:hypothetical protein
MGKEVRSRTFRWRSIVVRDHGVSNMAVIEEVARWLGDKRLEFTKVENIGPQAVGLDYSPSFNDESRVIILAQIKKLWPKANVGFYGEEAVVILRSVVCLDECIQGSDR